MPYQIVQWEHDKESNIVNGRRERGRTIGTLLKVNATLQIYDGLFVNMKNEYGSVCRGGF